MRLTALLAFLVVACGGKSEIASGPVDSGTARVPASHRAVATACPTMRGDGHPIPGGGGSCENDSDCTMGRNGRCTATLPSPNACSYDECTVDSECGSGVCDCRASSTDVAPNRCFKGTCRVDADCDGGKGHCSGSGNDLSSSCMGPPIGSFGFFCHTAADECVDHADCGADRRCMFDAEKLHWRCFEIACAL